MPDPRVELRLTARDQTAAAFQSVRRGLGTLDTQIGTLRSAVLRLGPAFAAIGAGVSVAAFTRFVSAGIDVADQLNTISKRTKVSVEDLSVLKFAAEQSDTSFDTLTTGLQKFEVKLAKAGISGNQTIAMLLGLADHFKATEDPAQRLSEAVAIFGKSAGPELVPFLSQGSEGINELIQKLRDMGGVITGETAKAADDFKDSLAAIGAQASALAANFAGPFLKSITEFISALRRASDISDAVERNEKFRDSAKGITDEITKIDDLLAGGAPAKEGIIARRAELEGLKKELLKTHRAALGLDAGAADAGTAAASPAEVAKILPQPKPPKPPKAPRGGGAGSALNDAKALIDASLAATQDALDREQRNLDQALEDELVSFRDFYAKRTAIALEGIDAEIAAKREALAQSKDQGDVARLTSEITVLERKRGDVAVQARRDQINAERELADQLAQVRARVLEAEGRTGEATRIRIEAEFRELTARLQIEGDTAGVELVKRLFSIEAARGQLTQLQGEFDRVREQLAREETRVNVQVDTGLQGELAGRREIVRLHTETAAKLAPIVDQMRTIAQTIGPEEVSRVAGLASEIDVLGTVTNEVAQSLNNEFKNAAASAFTDFLTGAKTAEQAFADFGKSILNAVAQIAAQNIAEELFGNLFKTGKKGAGGGGFFDLLGSLFHQGGIAGSPGPGRRIPALAFAGAPRLHDGGMLGLRANEVPAILQRGEEVLTRGDPRHRANQGAGNVTVIMNVSTPDAASFRRSSGQIAVEASTAIGRAARNRP
jgi:hypothetical protein